MSRAYSFSPLSRGGKVASTMLAAVCAAGVQVGVLALFHQASDEPWINPSPQLAQALAHCDTLRRPSQRDECTRQVAARARAPVTWTALVNTH